MVRTKYEDALDILGDEDLARALQADEEEREKADRRSKSRSRRGMVYKSEGEPGLSYGGATTMKDARSFLEGQEMADKFGGGLRLLDALVQNITDSSLTLEEKKKKLSQLLSEAKEVIADKGKVVKGGKQMSKSKARYVGIGGAHSLKAAVRYLQTLLGTKDLEIDLETLTGAVAKNILNLPPGQREKAALQLKADLKTFPSAEPTKPGSVRWIARLSTGGLDPSK